MTKFRKLRLCFIPKVTSCPISQHVVFFSVVTLCSVIYFSLHENMKFGMRAPWLVGRRGVGLCEGSIEMINWISSSCVNYLNVLLLNFVNKTSYVMNAERRPPLRPIRTFAKYAHELCGRLLPVSQSAITSWKCTSFFHTCTHTVEHTAFQSSYNVTPFDSVRKRRWSTCALQKV